MKEELRLLQSIAMEQKVQNKWDSSLFGVIKEMPTSNKGEVAERYIYQLCLRKNIKSQRNERTRDSYDILINDKKVEVKLATEDTSGKFQFNGIRYHRAYDFLLVLGVSPSEIFFNIFTSADVKTQKIGPLVSMEKNTVGSQKLTLGKSQLCTIYEFKSIIDEKTNLQRL